MGGDLAFVKQEWPIVQRELAYNAANVNSNNLLITSASDGMDWHYYDGNLTGAVTEYNALYYQALLDGSMLAQAAGFANLAAGYAAQAALVKTAINNTLFNATTGVYDISDSIKGTVAQDANSSGRCGPSRVHSLSQLTPDSRLISVRLPPRLNLKPVSKRMTPPMP